MEELEELGGGNLNLTSFHPPPAEKNNNPQICFLEPLIVVPVPTTSALGKERVAGVGHVCL